MSRRKHPLAEQETIVEAIKKENEFLQPIRNEANLIIDTTLLKPVDLREELISFLQKEEMNGHLLVSVVSFGFKNGIPLDADLVIDVRFLPNPYYIESLKNKTGNDQEVVDYVMNQQISQTFLNKLYEFISFLLPQYVTEGKNYLMIAIGCTGGQHRSVTITNRLHQLIQENGYNVFKKHRDIRRFENC